MEAEKLKVIAEGMGFWSVWVYENVVMFHKKDLGEVRYMPEGEIYNPLTNNDQMVEIMEKLGSLGQCSLFLALECLVEVERGDGSYHKEASGKTINEAVCNAAYEYFNQP